MNHKVIGSESSPIVYVTGYGDDGKMIEKYCKSHQLDLHLISSEADDLQYLTLLSPLKWKHAVKEYNSGSITNIICKIKPKIAIFHSLATLVLIQQTFPFIEKVVTTAGVVDMNRPLCKTLINYFHPNDIILKKLLTLGKPFSETTGIELTPSGILPSIHADLNILPVFSEDYNFVQLHSYMKLAPLPFLYEQIER